jgi:hypothetical protein
VDLLAPVFTMVKWIFVGGSFVLLAVGVVGRVWRAVGGDEDRSTM